jgi:DNA-binding NtrC family response regulator
MSIDRSLRAVVATADRELGEKLLAWLNEENVKSVAAPTGATLEQALIAEPDLILVDETFSDDDLPDGLGHRQSLWQETTLIGTDEAALGHRFASFLRDCPTLHKPVRRSDVSELLERVSRRKALVRESGLIGTSDALRQLVETISQVAPTEISVLLTGESGAGKDLVAHAIHAQSPRRSGPFLAANCGALAESLLESELFGHERGAFTGAVSRRAGLFEAASGGTLFLDEIGEMSPATQVKLLRVLETREFFRVGGSQPIRADVRVIAATNRNLAEATEEGAFRRDLFYRLKVFDIHVPSLRERPEDIPPLVEAYGRQFAAEQGTGFDGITPEARRFLMRYRWPGNVRELLNLIQSLVVSGHSEPVEAKALPPHIRQDEGFDPWRLPVRTGRTPEKAERELLLRTLLQIRADMDEIKELLTERAERARPATAEVVVTETQTVHDAEGQLIDEALRQSGGNRRAAADALGISERTLYRRLRERAHAADGMPR